MSKSRFLDHLSSLTKSTRQADETLVMARKGNSESDFLRALGSYTRLKTAARQSRAQAYLAAIQGDEETYLALRGAVKLICRLSCTADEADAFKAFDDRAKAAPDAAIRLKALSEAGDPGLSLGATQLISPVVVDLIPEFSVAGSTMNLRPSKSGSFKGASVTGTPAAQWFTQGQQPVTLTADVGLAGASVTGLMPTLGLLAEISGELVQDSKVNPDDAQFINLILTRFAVGISAGIDNAAINGDGVADTSNGGQYGIFQAAGVPDVNASAGNTDPTKLVREDFLAVAAAVNPAALQRGARWWTHPSFLPLLMTIKAGASDYLVKSPVENGTDDWSLCGWPLSLTVAAPSVNAPGSPALAFGHGLAYSIGLREQLEFAYAQPRFSQNIFSVRAIARALCAINAPSWFAILNLAAQ